MSCEQLSSSAQGTLDNDKARNENFWILKYVLAISYLLSMKESMGIDICISYPITMKMTKTAGHTKKQCQNATNPASKWCPNIENDFPKSKRTQQEQKNDQNRPPAKKRRKRHGPHLIF
jgi:hypothetical protein